jgi:hypothetical protein
MVGPPLTDMKKAAADLDITAACPRSEPLMTTILADPRRADEGSRTETIAKRSAKSRAGSFAMRASEREHDGVGF